jgi:titin
VDDNTYIDGQSEPDFNGVPLIELDGSAVPANGNGLYLTGDAILIQGLIINDFPAWGIRLDGSSNSTVRGNYIGTDKTGTAPEGNHFAGIALLGGSTGVTIDRNIISGNDLQGVVVTQQSNNNFIIGNYIGTDVTGTLAVPNVYGIQMQDSTGTVIGGTGDGAGNVISGNFSAGVIADFSGNSAVIQGNLVGLNAAGTAALPNGGAGVELGSMGHMVGGTQPGARNVISGNGSNGIQILGSDITIQGNHIGTDITGMAAIANGQPGIQASGMDSTNIVIGGTAAAARNVISGNQSGGVALFNVGDGAVVQGNYIGVAADGATPLGNGYNGLSYYGGTATIGGPGTGAGNLIAHNDNLGMSIGSSPAVLVEGNVVRDNAASGIEVFESAPVVKNNVISGNGSNPVSSGPVDPYLTSGVYLGFDSNGAQVAGNTITENLEAGVYIDGINARVGGLDPGDANLISENGGAGVFVAEDGGPSGEDAFGNTITRNSIFNNGELGIDLHPPGVVDDDAGDVDQGANNRQNAPVLTQADSGSLILTGTLNSTPNSNFIVEFFATGECDASGHGEGQTYLASDQVATGDAGNATLDIELAVDVPSGQFITATATSAVTGDTSEFSNCVEVDAPTPTASPTPSATPAASPTPTPIPNAPRGDGTCNGIVDLDDVIAALSEFAGVEPGAPCPERANVDCDSDIDAEDALRIAAFFAGVPLPQGTGCGAIGV